MERLIQKSGGYKRLVSYQVAELTYDVTVQFCNRYISIRSRTHDQMVQAARSGVQNIVEGSLASATSKKTELKLTNVARASLGELLKDYADFLRQRSLPLWTADDPRRWDLVRKRLKTADEVAHWVHATALSPESIASMASIPSMPSQPSRASLAECDANAGNVLAGVASNLLFRQLSALAKAFEREGGFTERLYRVRQARRVSQRSY
ncbi:MAG: four helix bundle suffix domain-containing protein [Myxococcales bacterium]